MALTKKQRNFIAYYCGEANWNATKAAQMAGYKDPEQSGYENKRKLEIQDEIEARIAAIMPKGEIISRLAARGRSSLADVVSLPALKDDQTETKPTLEQRTLVGDDKWRLDLIKAQKTGGVHQIKKLKETKYGTEVEVYDSLPALELLAKQSGILKDDGGILKYLDLSKLSPAQLQRLADGDDPLAVLLNTTTDPGESAT